jgi:hypothetical protein
MTTTHIFRSEREREKDSYGCPPAAMPAMTRLPATLIEIEDNGQTRWTHQRSAPVYVLKACKQSHIPKDAFNNSARFTDRRNQIFKSNNEDEEEQLQGTKIMIFEFW